MKLRILSFVLIFSFGFLLIPKDLWHSCDKIHHSHNEEKNQDESFSTSDNSCSICDFDLFQLDFKIYSQIYFEKSNPTSLAQLIASISLVDAESNFNKGPPFKI